MPDRPLRFDDIHPDRAAALADIRDNRFPVYLLLDGLEDPKNMGQLLRLSDAARLAGIYTWQMSEQLVAKKLQRVARSTQQYVPIHPIQTTADLDRIIADCPTYGLEWTDRSTSIWDFSPPAKILLVIGSEKRGISSGLLERVQGCIHIPMFGINSSMNVSMATGIAVYGVLEKISFSSPKTSS